MVNRDEPSCEPRFYDWTGHRIARRLARSEGTRGSIAYLLTDVSVLLAAGTAALVLALHRVASAEAAAIPGRLRNTQGVDGPLVILPASSSLGGGGRAAARAAEERPERWRNVGQPPGAQAQLPGAAPKPVPQPLGPPRPRPPRTARSRRASRRTSASPPASATRPCAGGLGCYIEHCLGSYFA